MQTLYDVLAEILTELMQYGEADESTVRCYIEQLNNCDWMTGVQFVVDHLGVVDFEEVDG